MIISHKYKCICLQPRKVGSTSLAEFFKSIDPQVKEDYDNLNKEIPPYEHQVASEVRVKVGEEIWNSYFKFSFIRDPFDWVKSFCAYESKLTWSNDFVWNMVKVILRHNRTLVLNKGTITSDNLISFYTLQKWWYLPAGVSGQVGWLDEDLDHIGIFENIDEEMKYIGGLLGLPSYTIPKLNKSNSSNLKMEPEAYQLISILFKEDIDLYNRYSQLPMEKR